MFIAFSTNTTEKKSESMLTNMVKDRELRLDMLVLRECVSKLSARILISEHFIPHTRLSCLTHGLSCAVWQVFVIPDGTASHTYQ